MTDGEAITASVADPARFGQVFDRHVDAIYGYLCRRVGRTSAEELTSETFARAFDGRERFSGQDALPWLYGIATNLIRHHARAERRQLAAYARVASRDVRDAADDEVEGRLDAAAMGPALAEALRRLRPEERDVLLMHAWQGLSYRDIADALDIAIGAVGSRLTRARATVREVLHERGHLMSASIDVLGGIGAWSQSAGIDVDGYLQNLVQQMKEGETEMLRQYLGVNCGNTGSVIGSPVELDSFAQDILARALTAAQQFYDVGGTYSGFGVLEAEKMAPVFAWIAPDFVPAAGPGQPNIAVADGKRLVLTGESETGVIFCIEVRSGVTTYGRVASGSGIGADVVCEAGGWQGRA